MISLAALPTLSPGSAMPEANPGISGETPVSGGFAQVLASQPASELQAMSASNPLLTSVIGQKPQPAAASVLPESGKVLPVMLPLAAPTNLKAGIQIKTPAIAPTVALSPAAVSPTALSPLGLSPVASKPAALSPAPLSSVISSNVTLALPQSTSAPAMADDAQVQSASVVQIAAATASQASAQVLVARGRPVDAGSVDASPDTPELQETPTESAPVAPASKMKAAVAALVRQATVSRTAAKDGDGQSEANTETPVVVDASIAATPTGDPAAAIVALSPLPGMTQPETFAADKPNASNVKRSAVRMPDQKIQSAQQQAITQTQTQDQTQTSNQPQDQNQSHAQATLAGFNAQSARTGLHVTLSAAEKNSSDPVGPVKFETAEQSSATTVPVLATVIGNEVSAAPVTTPLAAADRPADFTQIVDRLVAAREAAGSSNHAQPVQISVQHADFGKVSLKFTQDQGNLAVAMSSADPGFARAVQASAPAQQQQMSGDTAANQSNGQTAQRQQDTVLAQSQGQGQALGQGQGQPSSRQTSAMSRQDRTVAANHSNDSDQDRAPDRRGLFA